MNLAFSLFAPRNPRSIHYRCSSLLPFWAEARSPPLGRSKMAIQCDDLRFRTNVLDAGFQSCHALSVSPVKLERELLSCESAYTVDAELNDVHHLCYWVDEEHTRCAESTSFTCPKGGPPPISTHASRNLVSRQMSTGFSAFEFVFTRVRFPKPDGTYDGIHLGAGMLSQTTNDRMHPVSFGLR